MSSLPGEYFPSGYFPPSYFGTSQSETSFLDIQFTEQSEALDTIAIECIASPAPVIGGRFKLIEHPARPQLPDDQVAGNDDEEVIALVMALIA